MYIVYINVFKKLRARKLASCRLMYGLIALHGLMFYDLWSYLTTRKTRKRCHCQCGGALRWRRLHFSSTTTQGWLIDHRNGVFGIKNGNTVHASNGQRTSATLCGSTDIFRDQNSPHCIAHFPNNHGITHPALTHLET